MSFNEFMKKFCGICLVLAMVFAMAMPVSAADVSFKQVDNSQVTASMLKEENAPVSIETGTTYRSTDIVRVAIILEAPSTIDQGFSTMGISENKMAMSYSNSLETNQDFVTNRIEKAIGEELDVKWNITLIANVISADVEYGQIKTIEKVKGVKAVQIEQQFVPMVASVEDENSITPSMALSGGMTHVNGSWENGYTGFGKRIAIIDTGLDTDHQSVTEEGYLYSMAVKARSMEMNISEYGDSLNLLDVDEINEKMKQLNAYDFLGQTTANKFYINKKVPFGFNYYNNTFDVTHDNDNAGNHGSHVAGIAAANNYVKVNGTFKNALDAVKVVGNAPDAQLLVMKIFGGDGGAYEGSIYASIEDAIILDADTVNLSLGSQIPGNSTTGLWDDVMQSLKNSDTLVICSAANLYDWPNFSDNSNYLGDGSLYADDVNMLTCAAPGTATNAMSVASVENAGAITSGSLLLNGKLIDYNDQNVAPDNMKEFPTLDTTADGSGTEYEYVMVESYGEEGDFDDMGCDGKIVLVSRGKQINFGIKANNAAKAGAAGVIIYNNVDGSINMSLDGYEYSAPCVSMTLTEAKKFKTSGEKHETEDGRVYYTGKMTIKAGLSVTESGNDYYTISDFSSWGTTGDLALKPEISAPGGKIYSINGGGTATDRYIGMSGTSMSSPQVAGIGALVSQFIEEKGYEGDFADPHRGLAQSLLMSTAVPMKDSENRYFPLIQQGTGMVNAGAATSADSYIKMGSNASLSYDDGKVKAEIGDDPERSGIYTFDFEIRNLDGEEHTYDLSADVFAQDHFNAQASADGTYTTEYMSKSTVSLGADAAFTVKGENVTSVTVDKNGKAMVTVTITLTEDAKQNYLEKYFKNGTYVQAFVFADARPDNEGNDGTTHSIPMLAFYGSWTDPSMFWGTRSEEGQYAGSYSHDAINDDSRGLYFDFQYQNGPGEPVLTYYPENYFNVTANGYSIKLGGNPLVADEKYREERNSVPSDVVLTSGLAHLSRNASQQIASISSLDSGKSYYYERQTTDVIGAFRNQYTEDYGISNYHPGNRLDGSVSEKNYVEGERIEFSLTYLPEYYNEGKLGYGKEPGDGASMSVTAVVDNTLPQTENIELDAETQTFRVTAADNRYVAAVVLYNAAGNEILSYDGAKPEIDPGEDAVYELKLNDIEDRNYLIQVFDYALNTATYRISINNNDMSQYGAMIAYDMDKSEWALVGEDIPDLRSLHKDSAVYKAATSIGQNVFAVTESDELYVLTAPQLDDALFVDHLEQSLTDMAYCSADGYLYGVSDANELVRIDALTGQSSIVGEIPFLTNTLACDAEGIFYSNKYGTGEVYRYTLDTVTTKSSLDYDFNADGMVDLDDNQLLLDYVTGKASEIDNENAADIDADGDIDTYDAYLLQQALPYLPELLAVAYTTESRYLQAMEIDPNNGMLYWASYFTDLMQGDEIAFSYFWSIDPKNGEIERHSDYWDQLSSLVILDKDTSSKIPAADSLARLNITTTNQELALNQVTTIAAGVSPWNVEDPSIIWASSDESVATVDENGNVTAVGEGTCRIIATSAMDSNISADCEITVSKEGAKEEPVKPTAEVVAFANVNNEAKTVTADYNATLTIDIPAAADLTNGLQTVSMDTTDLTLLSISGADLLSFDRNESLLTIGYVHKEMVKAGETVVTLTFEAKKCGEERAVVLRELERNNEHLKLQSVMELGSHTWGEWESVTDATCKTEGLKKRTCGICHETEERTIPVLEHKWSEWSEIKAASCVENGTEQRVCELCKDTEERAIPAVGSHSWGEWKVTRATCGTDGEKVRECANCDATEREIIPASGNHRFGEWEITIAATETMDGEKTRYCANCDAKETEKIPATGHICPALEFTDLDTTKWYHEGVDFVLTNGYMYGVGNGLFEPDGELTRAQLVTILYRIEGSPDVSALENPFTDLTQDWYINAVIWAASEGVVYGVGNGRFAPNDNITREQIATILYRYSGANPVSEDHIGSFADAAQISSFAVEAMNWAVSEGLINGVGNNKLSPESSATRAQIATILMRYLGA